MGARCPRSALPPRARGPRDSPARTSVRPPLARSAQPGPEVVHPASPRAVPGAHAAAGSAALDRQGKGLPGGGARAASPPPLTSSPSPRCTLSEVPLPWPDRYAAAQTVPPRPAAGLHPLSLARSGSRRPALPASPPIDTATPARAPGATDDSRGRPAPPLPTTTAHAWPWPPSPAPVQAHPCPRHVGTCSPHHRPLRAPEPPPPPRHVQTWVLAQRLACPTLEAALHPLHAPFCLLGNSCHSAIWTPERLLG